MDGRRDVRHQIQAIVRMQRLSGRMAIFQRCHFNEDCVISFLDLLRDLGSAFILKVVQYGTRPAPVNFLNRNSIPHFYWFFPDR